MYSISIAVITLLLLSITDALYNANERFHAWNQKEDETYQKDIPVCSFLISETIPEGMFYSGPDNYKFPSTIDVWLKLINEAQHTISIVAFYWTLTNTDSKNTTFRGIESGIKVFEALKEAARRNVTIRIIQNEPSSNHQNEDSAELADNGYAEVRNIYMPRYIGGGVLHSKFIISDDSSFYLGSANMDWRALTDVKELGAYISNCPDATTDLLNIFHVYWGLGVPNAVFPAAWPQEFGTQYNHNSPIRLGSLNNDVGFLFFGNSPPKFCPPGRSTDLQAIIHVMSKARRFIFISVMSYRPIKMYSSPQRYWGIIDTQIRAAAFERKVEIRLLVAKWRYFKDNTHHFLKSLMALSGVNPRVRIMCKEFEIPADEEQAKIPFARVNHAKFMVTDSSAYIGTSNWIGNYFIDTAGVGLVVNGKTMYRKQLQGIFMRDWNSQFATHVNLNLSYYDSNIGMDQPLG